MGNLKEQSEPWKTYCELARLNFKEDGKNTYHWHNYLTTIDFKLALGWHHLKLSMEENAECQHVGQKLEKQRSQELYGRQQKRSR